MTRPRSTYAVQTIAVSVAAVVLACVFGAWIGVIHAANQFEKQSAERAEIHKRLKGYE